MKKENWIWMPHAGHFCGSIDCRFRMNTYVGSYIVSTVGEYFPGSNRTGKPEEIGMNRLYETMVFKARKSTNKCCPYEMASGSELDMEDRKSVV